MSGKTWRLLLVGAALSLALVGCGAQGATSGGAGPTQSTGPVTIATDHSAYAPMDPIHITISNHLSSPIYAYDTQASCSILGLEMQQAGQWAPANALHCPLGRVALPVKIAAGADYRVTIGATVSHIGAASPLANGTYRLALAYYPAPLSGSAQQPAATLAYSAPLTVSEN